MPDSLAKVGNPKSAVDVERLECLVDELQAECARLRAALEESQRDRDRFRYAFYDRLREAREFEDFDIPKLQAKSAGPVESLS